MLPCIGAGSGFTVITIDCVHPAPAVSVMVAVLCVATFPPVIVVVALGPPGGVTVATSGLLLLQVPLTPSVSVVVSPAHIVVLPDIAVGSGFTVTVVVLMHPVGTRE